MWMVGDGHRLGQWGSWRPASGVPLWHGSTGNAVSDGTGSDDRFGTMMEQLRNDAVPRLELAQPFVHVLPVAGSAVSTIGDLLGTETVSATDAQAAKLDELQFDLGEGPCWDALRLERPVLEPDASRPRADWPAFSEAVRHDIGALFAFPMLIGPLKIGAVDMYATAPGLLTRVHIRQATALADQVARILLHQAVQELSDGTEDEAASNPFSRRIIHQATGMVLAQLAIAPDDARLVIQSHAFATGRSMMEVSQDLLDGRLDFSVREGRIEDSQ